MPTDLFETVDTLVKEELGLFRSLEELVDDEEEKVRQSDMEGLLEVLRQKQSIISRQEFLLEKWDGISASLGLESGREGPALWNSLAERIGESGYNQIVSSINEIRELGQKLLDREGQIRAALEENLAEMRGTLLKMGKNRLAMRGYSQGMTAY